MEKIFAMALRGGLSFLLGLGFGLVGVALFSSIIPPYWSERLIITSLCVGVCIGIAVFFSWFKPESSGRVIVIAFILAFGISIIGSFAGFVYANVFEVEVRNTMLIGRGSAESSAMWAMAVGWSTLFATLFSGGYYAFRLFRYHEV